MSDFPALTGQRLIKALAALGFTDVRQKGSHHFIRHPDGRCTVVPVHSGEMVGRGLLADPEGLRVDGRGVAKGSMTAKRRNLPSG